MELLEKNIIEQISAGNVRAFERFFFKYQPKVLAFLIGMTHDPEQSRDMTQDIFLTVWKNRDELKRYKSLSSYLYSMAKHKSFDYFDHLAVTERYIHEYLSKVSGLVENEEEILFAKELKDIIEREVEQMSPQRKKIYKLSRVEGLSNDEIAKRLNISKRTVENHLTVALAMLRKVIYMWIILLSTLNNN